MPPGGLSGFVGGVDQEDAVLVVADEDVGADAFAGLLGVAFGQVPLPCLGVALVERGHR
jgi:hypothetical protein